MGKKAGKYFFHFEGFPATKSVGEIDSREHELQHLKDRLRIQQDTITSLRNQIKMVKFKKKE
jgi:hypothetical protein